MTIKYPDAFERSPSAGFDGVFDWSWTDGCFGDQTNYSPQDVDGVLERNGQFLVMETKKPGWPIPVGQMIFMERLHALGVFTIMIIHGKTVPETATVWFPGRDTRRKYDGVDACRRVVSKWYAMADAQTISPTTGELIAKIKARKE